jgi:hypothetical protein
MNALKNAERRGAWSATAFESTHIAVGSAEQGAAASTLRTGSTSSCV